METPSKRSYLEECEALELVPSVQSNGGFVVRDDVQEHDTAPARHRAAGALLRGMMCRDLTQQGLCCTGALLHRGFVAQVVGCTAGALLHRGFGAHGLDASGASCTGALLHGVMCRDLMQHLSLNHHTRQAAPASRCIKLVPLNNSSIIQPFHGLPQVHVHNSMSNSTCVLQTLTGTHQTCKHVGGQTAAARLLTALSTESKAVPSLPLSHTQAHTFLTSKHIQATQT